MTTLALTEADAQRRAALTRMRALATGLFVFAIVVFVATLHRGGVWGYVNATAEAAEPSRKVARVGRRPHRSTSTAATAYPGSWANVMMRV